VEEKLYIYIYIYIYICIYISFVLYTHMASLSFRLQVVRSIDEQMPASQGALGDDPDEAEDAAYLPFEA